MPDATPPSNLPCIHCGHLIRMNWLSEWMCEWVHVKDNAAKCVMRPIETRDGPVRWVQDDEWWRG